MTESGLRCRSCGFSALQPILSLGTMPLANALLRPDELDRPEECYPLDLVFCPECTLVQLAETVTPQKLFRDYVYFSSFSETMVRHAEALASRLVLERRLGPASLVVELASNDGYLLQQYLRCGVPVLGIEPALNVAEVAERERGVTTLAEFFGAVLARRLRAEGRHADVVHAHNVLAHVADLNGFVEGIGQILKDDGIAVIEVPYLKDMLDRCEFDTIYHEHLCYFSATALDRLFRRHALGLRGLERIPVHGGSLRLFVGHGTEETPPEVAAILAEETAWGVGRPGAYQAFSGRVDALRESLRGLLHRLRGEGKRIAAYGAAAKGATLLNSLGLAPGTIEFVVDRSPHKQGRFLPGSHLPIYAPERLLQSQPDYLLLLAWNLADEVLGQQARYREGGGLFVVPVPEPRIV